jgi:hypothetical protein
LFRRHARREAGFARLQVDMNFTGDELILALISLVRVTHPSMLRQDADGFTVDFEALERSQLPSDEERLLLKIRPALETAADAAPRVIDLDAVESRRLYEALARLETAQKWPADVLAMSQSLRERLKAGF